jgi:hypothetical protein
MIQLFFPQFKDSPRAALIATVLLAITLAILPFVAGAAGNAWVRIILNPAVTHSLPADFAAPKTADVG